MINCCESVGQEWAVALFGDSAFHSPATSGPSRLPAAEKVRIPGQWPQVTPTTGNWGIERTYYLPRSLR